MANKNYSCVDFDGSDNTQAMEVIDEFDDSDVLERLEDLEKKVNGFMQHKTNEPEYSYAIARIECLEQVVNILIRRECAQPEDSSNDREAVLNMWSKCPFPPEGLENVSTIREGDICADIRVILAKEKTDKETADRWKWVLLDRYSLTWGVDCGGHNDLSSVSLEMIRVFNIRARVLYAWGNGQHLGILDVCDHWIGCWRRDNTTCISHEAFCKLCKLYYA
ncbi:hypothetical protein N7457_008862 [Penicillium paradoxum]|uniref:uncharacterized protein n=1 Tax=Penicillium paradoxum TaxID=176176 RepID=UPI00254694F8|nr:uncharacterized protein N7457_008862 [Penicillium paradoxum]KAJ5773966.1 hypothetical protein N7457_008862 [Penicillium paradoxum]